MLRVVNAKVCRVYCQGASALNLGNAALQVSIGIHPNLLLLEVR